MVAVTDSAGAVIQRNKYDEWGAPDMQVLRDGEAIEVTLIGNSPTDQQVEYELELSGSSTSRHKGITVLHAKDVSVLSKMRMNAVSQLCVTAKITEQNGMSYEFSEGSYE